MEERYTIIDGPDKWGLISSFADRRKVEFSTNAFSLVGTIQSIEHEDGSKNQFNIKLLADNNYYRLFYVCSERRGSARIEK
jgi:hypothetical protein